MPNSLFSTEQAADYLGLSIPALKYHIHRAKDITPQKFGHSYIFTQEQLDQFQLTRRPQGRPRKETK